MAGVSNIDRDTVFLRKSGSVITYDIYEHGQASSYFVLSLPWNLAFLKFIVPSG